MRTKTARLQSSSVSTGARVVQSNMRNATARLQSSSIFIPSFLTLVVLGVFFSLIFFLSFFFSHCTVAPPNRHMNSTLDVGALPIKMAGVGHCFRAEAGAGGTFTLLPLPCLALATLHKRPHSKERKQGNICPLSSLPCPCVGHCFRAEAGAGGTFKKHKFALLALPCPPDSAHAFFM